MDVLNRILGEASKLSRHIVLAEGTDARVVQAASLVVQRKLARITLIGVPAEVEKIAKDCGVSLEGVNVFNHTESENFEKYVGTYCELRKKKGMTPEVARRMVSDPVFYAALMVRNGEADGAVAGAINPTGNVIRAALHCIGTAQGVKTLSSFFIMIHKNTEFGHEGCLFFSDCGVLPDPNSDQLVEIAAETAKSFKALMQAEPLAAFLSYSSKGSAKGTMVSKVAEAADKMKTLHPEVISDGELQFDAALLKEIGERKAPKSLVAGRANVFIFPDLDAGNIGYKIAERLGSMVAVGPLLQGLSKPMNDLSRGCSVEDIVAAAGITALQTTVRR